VLVEREQFEAVALAGGEPARALVVGLLERIAVLERDIVRLSGRIGGLEQIARRDSGNSSVAPSADPPKSRQQRRAEARAKAKEQAAREGVAARKPGKQHGAAGSGRKLLGEEQIDEFAEYFPVACGGCDREFREDERVPGARIGRHQVFELPPIAVLVTEHRTHRLRCPACHAQTAGVLPEEVAGSAFGLVQGPHRVGKPLRRELSGIYSARRGTYRVLHRINEERREVIVLRVEHRREVYRPR
jgi:ParE toxin of type II toxin-antitoxin system, parDE